MITSDAQLQAVLRAAVSVAINDVMTWGEQELIKTIQESGASVNGGGLEIAWVKEARGMWGQIRHDPSLMSVNVDVGQHASPYDPHWFDIRGIFIDVIQGGYNAWSSSGRKVPPRKFWDKFVNRFESQFPKRFRAALRKQGLVVF